MGCCNSNDNYQILSKKLNLKVNKNIKLVYNDISDKLKNALSLPETYIILHVFNIIVTKIIL